MNYREQAGCAVVTDKEASQQLFAVLHLPALAPMEWSCGSSGRGNNTVLLIVYTKTTVKLTFGSVIMKSRGYFYSCQELCGKIVG